MKNAGKTLKIFKISSKHYSVNGPALRDARELLTNLNASEFAFRCGWSPTYQSRLENSDIFEVPESTREIIQDVLAER